MNPTRKRRLWMALLVLLAAAVGGSLIVWALQRNVTFLHSPTAVREGKVPDDARFRLGGVLLEGSVKRETGSLRVAFEVTDRFNNFPVVYDGILPDMFQEGTSVIATGRIEDGTLVADEVLAKHDEQYMPKEVADAIAAAQEKGAANGQSATSGPASVGTSGDAATPEASQPGGTY